MRQSRRAARGIAMIFVLIILTIVLLVVVSALIISGMDRRNAAREAHNTSAQNVTEAALQFARSFFGQNYASWNTYLAYFTTARTWTQVEADHPELVPPLALGANYNCFAYAKDDLDELPPAPSNFSRDNNLRIYVGALCVQKSVPAGQVPLMAELTAPLEYNPLQSQCQPQFGGGTLGTNNCSVVQSLH